MFRRKESYKIFISYERQDAAAWAGIIYQGLKERYGDGIVFKDVEETRTGTDWPRRLARLVRGCKAFVLIVGSDWNDARMIGKLNDPTNWVHKEIVAAVDAHKKIIPVVIKGAAVPTKEKVPEKISQALGLHYFEFTREDTNCWPGDIDKLCTDIEVQTGIKWKRLPATANRISLGRVLCRLDRHEHLGSAEKGFADGHQLFLAHGGKKAGFRYFAERCAWDVVTQHLHAGRPAASDDSPLVKNLVWGVFSGPSDAPTRPTLLLKDIANIVFTERLAGDQAAMEAWLADRIQKNNRPIVVCSTAPLAEDWVRIQEWFTIWKRLLRKDSVAQTVAVMLFLECGWWPWSRPDVQRVVNSGGYPVSHKMGKIHQRDLDQWLRSTHVQELVAEQLREPIAGECQRLYRFRRARHVDDIGGAIKHLWT
jgi:hypothetical protein